MDIYDSRVEKNAGRLQKSSFFNLHFAEFDLNQTYWINYVVQIGFNR